MKLMFVFNVFDAHLYGHQMQSYIKTLQNDSANQVVEYMLGQNDAFDIKFQLLELSHQIDNLHKPDILIAFGKLASFIAMFVKPKFKVVIDICCRPDIDKQLTSNMSQTQLSTYKTYADSLQSINDMFTTDDEDFYENHVYLVKTEHARDSIFEHEITSNDIVHCKCEQLSQVCNKLLEHISMQLQPKFVNEAFKNIVRDYADTSTEALSKFDHVKDSVYKLLVDTYSKIDDEVAKSKKLVGCSTSKQLVKIANFWKYRTFNGKVIAAQLYSTKYGGRKLMYSGSDGSTEGKSALLQFLNEEVSQIDRYSWGEVSGAVEHVLQKYGAVPVPAPLAIALLQSIHMHNTPSIISKIIRIEKDGYHYTRNIGGKLVTKIVYGNIGKDFKVLDTYDSKLQFD